MGRGFESTNARGNWKEKQPVYDGGSGNVVWLYFLHFAKFSPGVFLTWSYGPPAGRGSLRIPKTVSQYCVYVLCSHLWNKLLKWWNLIIPFWLWPPGKLSHFFDKKTKHEALTILFPYTGSPSRGKGKSFVAYQSHPQESVGLQVPQELWQQWLKGLMVGSQGWKEDPLSLWYLHSWLKGLACVFQLVGFAHFSFFFVGGGIFFKRKEISWLTPQSAWTDVSKDVGTCTGIPSADLSSPEPAKFSALLPASQNHRNKRCHQFRLLWLYLTYFQNVTGRGCFVSHSCSINPHRRVPHHFCRAECSWPAELNDQPDQHHGSGRGNTQPPASVDGFTVMPEGSFLSWLSIFWLQNAYTPKYPCVCTRFLRNYRGVWREAPHTPCCLGPLSFYTPMPRGVTRLQTQHLISSPNTQVLHYVQH